MAPPPTPGADAPFADPCDAPADAGWPAQAARLRVEVALAVEEVHRLRRDLMPPAPSLAACLLVLFWPAWTCFVLATPVDTFAQSRGYAMMAALAPEPVWSYLSGGFALSAGLCFAVRTVAARRVGLGLLGAWHVSIGFLVFAAAPTSIGTGGFLLVAGFCALLFWRSW